MAKRILKIGCINVLVFFLCLFFFELIFGNWITPDRIKAINILRDVDLKFDVSNLYEYPKARIHYKRDKYGLRGQYSELNDIDILTIGGSTTDQRYISDGETWQDVLYDNFNKKISIVNAGVDGQSTYGNIKNFEFWFSEIPGLEAKYVLVYMGINDFFASSSTQNDDLAGNQTWKARIKSKSVLYHLFVVAKGTYLARFKYSVSHRAINFKTLAWTDKPEFSNHCTLMKTRLESIEQRVEKLAMMIREFGAEPIFVTQPARLWKNENKKTTGVTSPIVFNEEKINGLDFYHMMVCMYDKLEELSRENTFVLINLAEELNFQDDDYYDYYHNTPRGARKIGDYLYKKLKDIVIR